MNSIKPKPTPLGIFLCMISLWGCAGKPTMSEDSKGPLVTLAAQTSIDIRYHLGHSHRHLKMHVSPTDPSVIEAQMKVDGAVLKEINISAERYSAFISKVKDFVEKRRSLANTNPQSNPNDCHDPYEVVVENPQAKSGDTLKVDGCRIQDEGAFSRLVNEGEFLIYH
jgi:hypothetical protein